MTSKFTDQDLGWDKIMKGSAKVKEVPDLAIGFFDEENATKAAYNEYGTTNIPARPFFSTALDSKQKENLAQYRKDIALVVDGKAPPLAPAARLGVKVRNDIIESIQSGSWESNDPATIEAKGSSQPLVDTGAMQRAVTFETGKGVAE